MSIQMFNSKTKQGVGGRATSRKKVDVPSHHLSSADQISLKLSEEALQEIDKARKEAANSAVKSINLLLR